VPIWYELWRQLNGFPPDFVGEPEAEAKGGKAGGKEKKADKGGSSSEE
jgi:hypothetical protein